MVFYAQYGYIGAIAPAFDSPFSPSLICRTVSVDVKHHVYLLCFRPSRLGRLLVVQIQTKRFKRTHSMQIFGGNPLYQVKVNMVLNVHRNHQAY